MQSSRSLRIASSLLRNAKSGKSAPPTPSAFSGRLKESTSIFGLQIQQTPLSDLNSTYDQTLSVLSALPRESVYRQATEALVQHRKSVVEQFNKPTPTASPDSQDALKAHEDAIQRVEQELDAGQIEEVLVQAKDELQLAAKMIDWKPYLPLEHAAPRGQWQYFSMAEEAGEGN